MHGSIYGSVFLEIQCRSFVKSGGSALPSSLVSDTEGFDCLIFSQNSPDAAAVSAGLWGQVEGRFSQRLTKLSPSVLPSAMIVNIRGRHQAIYRLTSPY